MFVGDPIVVETGNINVLAILEDSYIPTYFFITIRNVISHGFAWAIVNCSAVSDCSFTLLLHSTVTMSIREFVLLKAL